MLPTLSQRDGAYFISPLDSCQGLTKPSTSERRVGGCANPNDDIPTSLTTDRGSTPIFSSLSFSLPQWTLLDWSMKLRKGNPSRSQWYSTTRTASRFPSPRRTVDILLCSCPMPTRVEDGVRLVLLLVTLVVVVLLVTVQSGTLDESVELLAMSSRSTTTTTMRRKGGDHDDATHPDAATSSSFIPPDSRPPFPPWKEGYLELHHLFVGSSVSTFGIFPDGTTLLIDAGEVDVEGNYYHFNRRFLRHPWHSPNETKDAAGWIVDYIQAVWPQRRRGRGGPERDEKAPQSSTVAAGGEDRRHLSWLSSSITTQNKKEEERTKMMIDYALVTHFHRDHIGDVKWGGRIAAPLSSKFPDASYRRTGIPAVGEDIPFRILLDRAYPHYNYPRNLTEWDPINFFNYWQFVQYHVAHGHLHAEAFQVGSCDQIRPQYSSSSSHSKNKASTAASSHTVDDGNGNQVHFVVRNVRSNLLVSAATPTNSSISAIDDAGLLNTDDPPNWDENKLSAGIVIEYGMFRYYEGADQEHHSASAQREALDTVGPTARVTGRVDVATSNHHMIGDTPEFVRRVDPTIVVHQGWASDQVVPSVVELFQRLPRQTPSDPPRRGFATYLYTDRLASYGRDLVDFFESTAGHVVVRVHPPTITTPSTRRRRVEGQYPHQFYEIFVLDENRRIKSQHGPFQVSEKGV